MPRYSRTVNHRVFNSVSSFENRKNQIRKAIEKTTGISTNMLRVIEVGMEKRKNHPLLKTFLDGQARLPSSQKIISRLLSAPLKQGTHSIAEHLFTEYRVSLTSSRGKVEIVAVMRLFRKRGMLSFGRSNGVISVKYIIHSRDDIHEYRQDFLLSKKQFVTSRHSAMDYKSNIPPHWKSKLAPKLLAPPVTVYL